MQISLSKFLQFVTWGVGFAMLVGYGYFCYILFFTGETVDSVPDIRKVSTGALGPRGQKAASALLDSSDKINLKTKDLIFTQTDLFKSFDGVPGDVPLSDSRGRPDPFNPYVAP